MAPVKGISVRRIVIPFALCAGIGLSPGVSHAAAVGARDQATHGDEPPRGPFITRVEGPSNFHRLSIPIEESAMGRTGLLGPPPGPQAVPPPAATYSEDMTRPVTLTGADLYRLGCQSCHRADGSGAPPEINALIGPVQATSATLMERRMKERGRPISATFARELAAGSLKDLRDRLKNGGRKMPSFAYLTDREAEALIGYLDRLAGMPGPAKELAVTEPGARVGELLVKGTCHICHDATGLWPSTEDLLQGAVPPLARFAAEKTVLEVVRKVRHGAPVTMGIVPFPYRGRMPVFDYLSDDEVVSAYLYLMTYPPRSAGSLRPPPN